MCSSTFGKLFLSFAILAFSVSAYADGTFSITSITPNPVMEAQGSVLVTVSRIGSTVGSSATINYATLNGSATAGEDYTDQNGSLIWTQNDPDTFKTFSITIADNAAGEQDETFTVTITPDASEVIGINSGEVIIIGDPTVAIDPSVYNVSEDGGSVTVFVTRANVDDSAVSVDFTTTDGTAVAGEDYTSTSGTLNWGAAELGAKPINIPILADVDDLGPEAFTVDLTGCSNCSIIAAKAQATVNISEGAGTLAFDPIAILVSENSGNASVSVTRTGGTDGAVTIGWTTVSGSATSPADYTAAAGTLSWADGVGGTKLIWVPIIDDDLIEPTQSFTVMFVADSETGTQGLPTIGASLATVSIADNDELGTSLTLDKSSDVATYSAIDDVINYSYLVTSSGTGPVAGPITVADDKETVICPPVNSVGNNDDNLDSGESLTCAATHTVVQADIDASSITNTATASGDAAADFSNQDSVTVNYEAPATPALTLDKTSDVATYSAIDDVINYSYLVESSGTGPVTGPITVADDRETVTCPAVDTVGNNDDNLDPGESLTCTATHTVVQADIDATSITNTATASGGAAADFSNQDSVTVNYLPAAPELIFCDGFETRDSCL